MASSPTLKTATDLRAGGTNHVGRGSCQEHEDESETDTDVALTSPGPSLRPSSYGHITTNPVLKSHIRRIEQLEGIDSMDDEIVAMKAIVSVLIEQFGLAISWKPGDGRSRYDGGVCRADSPSRGRS